LHEPRRITQFECPILSEKQFASYPEAFSRSHDAVIRVYDESGNVIETHEHKGEFKGR
jgi:hypothetical protein